MANAQFENMVSVKKHQLPKVSHAQVIRIAVKENADKILHCGADSFVNNYECMSGEVSVFGRTNVRILYCDSEGHIYSANYNADYTERIVAEVGTSDKMCFSVSISECNCEASGNVIIINLLLEISSYTFCEINQPVMVGGEDMFVRFRDVELLEHAQCFNIAAEISQELTATKSISRILSAEGQLCVTKSTRQEDTLTIDGEGTVVLLYLTEDEQLVCDRLPFVFSEEKDIKGLPQGGELTVSAVVKNTRLRLDVEEDVVNSTFTAEMAIQLNITSTQCGTMSVVDDAYCKDSQITLTQNTVVTSLPCVNAVIKKSVEQTLPSSVSGKAVACINWRATVTNVVCSESDCEVTGLLCGDIMSVTAEGLSSIHTELPFAERLDIDGITGNYSADVVASVVGVTVKGVGSTTVCAELCFEVQAYREVRFGVINDVSEQPLETQKRCAIEVCLAKKGDTLWELAKGLHMSEEDILTVNPDLTSPLQQDTKVVIYNKL